MSEISHRVTSHMSESVLFKIQELTGQFQAYKKAQRHYDSEYDDHLDVADTIDESSSFISDAREKRGSRVSDFDDLSLVLSEGNSKAFMDRSDEVTKLTKDMGQLTELFSKM